MRRTPWDEPPIFLAKPKAECSATVISRYQLMVSDQRDTPLAQVKTSHAVGFVRNGSTVAHDIAETG